MGFKNELLSYFIKIYKYLKEKAIKNELFNLKMLDN